MATLITLSMLIIVVCNLGVLYLWFWMKRNLVDNADDQQFLGAMTLQRIDKFARDTDYDFRAIKTRLRDEEKDDQRVKAADRRKEVQS